MPRKNPPETAATIRDKADANGKVVADIGAYINEHLRRVPWRRRWSLSGPHARTPAEVAEKVNHWRAAWRDWQRIYRRDRLAHEYASRRPGPDWSRPVWIGKADDTPGQPILPKGAIDPRDDAGRDADAADLLAGHLGINYITLIEHVERWCRATRRNMWDAYDDAGGHERIGAAGRAATTTFATAYADMMKRVLLPMMDRLAAEVPVVAEGARDVLERWADLGAGRHPNTPNVIDAHNETSGRVGPGTRIAREELTIGQALARRLAAMKQRAEGGRGKGASDAPEARSRLLIAFGHGVGTDPEHPTPADRRPEADELDALGVGLGDPLGNLADDTILARFLNYWYTPNIADVTLPNGRPAEARVNDDHNTRKNRVDAVFSLLHWLKNKARVGYALPDGFDLGDYRMPRHHGQVDDYDPARMKATIDLARGTPWWPRIMLMVNCSFGNSDLADLNVGDLITGKAPGIFRERGRLRIRHKDPCPDWHPAFHETMDALAKKQPGVNPSSSPDAPLLINEHGKRINRREMSRDWHDRAERAGAWGVVYELNQLRKVPADFIHATHGTDAYRLMLSRPIPVADRPYIRRYVSDRLGPALDAWRRRLLNDGCL